jgi:hypothetical protein
VCRVEVRLAHQEQRSAGGGGEGVDRRRQLLQEVDRAVVGQGVHGVQPQSVDPVVAQPGQRAADQVPAHLVGAGGVEVDRRAPGGVVALREVGAKARQVVAGGAEMVVDDVQDDPEAEPMCCVDKALESLRSAIGLVYGPERHPVVAPAVGAGKGADRHHLDQVDTELDQVVEPGGGGVEGALGGEGADVQLVQHAAGQRAALPGTRRPAEGGVVDEL